MHVDDFRAKSLSARPRAQFTTRFSAWSRRTDALLGTLPGGAVLQEALRGWKTFVVAIAIAIVAGLIFLATATPQYTATIVVAPSPQGGRDNLSLGSGIGSSLLQNLPGMGANTSASVSPYVRFLEGLTSYDVVHQVQQKHHFLQLIYPEQWDTQSRQWRTPDGALAAIKSFVKSLLGYPHRPPGPDDQDLREFITRHLDISSSESSSIRTLEFSYKDQRLAQQMLAAIVQETDNAIREDARKSSSSYSAYLNRALAETTTAEVRLALGSLVLEQQRRIMTISGGQPYAASIIDGPYVSHGPTSPKPALALALCVLLGLIVATGIIMVRSQRRTLLRQDGDY